jgi:hypothetical protein
MHPTNLDTLRLRLVAFALAGAAACGGKTESLGTTGLMSISVSQLTGNVPSCPAGDAHRNVCCRATANGDAECGIYPASPFHLCGSGWTTYPVPGTCCDLADPTQCEAPPASAVPPPAGRCVYACPPGFTPDGPVTEATGECCASGPSGSMCFGWGPDEGDAGDSSTLCDVACPFGWSKSPAAPDVCIKGSESFSQATGPNSRGVTPILTAAPGETTVPNPDGAASFASDDGVQCALSGGEQGGHSYSLQCSNVTQICTCTEDSKTTTIAGVVVCQVNGNSAIVDLWVQGCGFPQ